MIAPRVVSFALLALVGCSRSGTFADMEPSKPRPSHGSSDASLEVTTPFALFDSATPLRFARAFARAGAFDVLANRKGPPNGVLARRGTVREGPLRLDFGAASPILVGVVNGTNGAVDGDLLALCHHNYNGDAIHFASFTGAYSKTAAKFISAAASCNGLAYRGERGLIAFHALPSNGKCCSRAVLSSISRTGSLSGPLREALGPGELADVGLIAYGRGFAWAGYVSGPAMRVYFAPDDAEERNVQHPEAGTEGLTVTRMARWPFDDRAVAVAYRPGDGAGRLLVVRDDGSIIVDRTITAPAGFRNNRPVIAPTTRGLVVAYARCPSDFAIKSGTLHIELWDPRGEVIAARDVTVGCSTAVSSAAALDDVVLITFPDGADSDGYLGVLARVL
jgi:hypothetical protein